MNASWELERVIESFLRSTRLKVQAHPSGATRDKAWTTVLAAYELLRGGRYYDACSTALEARALISAIEGPDRVEIAGRTLCAAIRAIHPLAPPGFERVGRMKNVDRPKGETPPPPASYEDGV